MVDQPAPSVHLLRGVANSLLIPLYIRAKETAHPDAILRDEWAVKLVQKLNLDEANFAQAQVSQEVQVSLLLRNRYFDRLTRDFLSSHPGTLVIYLGCGLDARFERVDDQQVEWYDLDLPDVIQVRRELMGGESCRYHLLGCSVLDHQWMDQVQAPHPSSTLLLAEGMLMFFTEEQVRRLVVALIAHFPHAQLVFDAFSPFYAWGNNRRVARTGTGAMATWSLKRPQDLEHWEKGIHLLSAWYPFLANEPRLAHLSWVKFLPFLAKTTGIFHYQFG